MLIMETIGIGTRVRINMSSPNLTEYDKQYFTDRAEGVVTGHHKNNHPRVYTVAWDKETTTRGENVLHSRECLIPIIAEMANYYEAY